MNLALVLLVVTLGAEPAPGQGRYAFLSVREVTAADLDARTAEELRLMRNEIFARHGFVFKSAELRLHFEAQDWYRAATTSTPLSAIEKKNVEVLQRAETTAAEKEFADLPDDLRDFWRAFRAAALQRDAGKLAGLIQFPLKHDLLTGDELQVTRSEFPAQLGLLFPSKAIERIRQGIPTGKEGFYRLFTPPLDTGMKVGRAYVIQKVGDGSVFKLTGIWVLAD